MWAVAAATDAPDIGIGGDEVDARTHLRFEASSPTPNREGQHLPDRGAGRHQRLNFFAVQVNFPNQTWAHGGPQVNSGAEKANWAAW